VETAFATLPEFDSFRLHTKTAPERRTGNRLIFESQLNLGKALIKRFATGDLIALR
jgi:hypothetical protein